MSVPDSNDVHRAAKVKPPSVKPLLKDPRFWLAQSFVVIFAVFHDVFELPRVTDSTGNVILVPISLMWAPIIYGALTLGFKGAIATTALAFVASIPNLFFLHAGVSRVWEVSQLALMALIAIILARLIEQRNEAQRRATIYASHSVRTQEDVWRDIGREVHDNTIQSLVTICLELDKIKYLGPGLPPEAGDSLARVRKYAEQAVSDLRSFTRDLRPSTLDELGLVVSVRRLVTGFSEQRGINAEVDVVGTERKLDPEIDTIVFRIVQEGLRNIDRHAKATRVSVVVTFAEKETVLSILDDGVGFEVPSSLSLLASHGKFGLIGMGEYAESLGGRLKIESHPGKGTQITAFIPRPDHNR